MQHLFRRSGHQCRRKYDCGCFNDDVDVDDVNIVDDTSTIIFYYDKNKKAVNC